MSLHCSLFTQDGFPPAFNFDVDGFVWKSTGIVTLSILQIEKPQIALIVEKSNSFGSLLKIQRHLPIHLVLHEGKKANLWNALHFLASRLDVDD